jgi:hypothetical protein
MKKNLLISVLAIVLTICLETFSKIKVGDAFLNTIYTVSGMMFSIGMGVVCTFNPERIKNNSFLNEIRVDIAKIRSNYIYFFSISSALYLGNQLLPNLKSCCEFGSLKLCVELPVAAIVFSSFGIIYYITNFLAIQKLNFQITDRINSEI